ncbi:MAG: hypothetical protein ILO36_03155, partial [Abditibacteriota bacterium]|nr:hypothetical protein [Abditibacteriota bacterium]
MHRLLFFILFLAVLSLQAGATVFVYSHKPNETLAKAVAEAFAGQTVKTVAPDGLVTLRGEGGDVLAVIGSQYFPKNAFPALEAFLDGGNHYLGISGLPFTEPLQKLGEKWLTAGEINAAAAGMKTGVLAPLSEMGAGDFILKSSEGRPDVALEPEDGMLHITAPRVADWQTYTLKRINQTDIDDDSFITFSAKGSLRSPAVWIFLQEKDGSRWNKKIELKNSVAEYALRADDFTYWQDSRSKGRGLDGDRLHLSQLDLAEISIMAGPKGEGVSLMDTVIGDPADIYISDICYFKTESGSSDASVPDMHCIYPAYEMHETEGGLLKDQAGNTSEGYARIASPLWRNRGYGTGYEGPFRQVPLATLYSGDEMRGIAAEAVYNYDRDKNNVYVYIGNDEKYLEKHPGYTARILKAAAKRLTGAPFIARGGVREFSVAPGEKPALGMTVRSGIKTGCKAEVSLTDENGGVLFSRSRALDCAPGEDFSFEYKGPALKKGFFTAVCRLYGENGELLDLLEMPFSVYAPEKRTAFNSVTRRGGDFWLKGQKWVPYGINYWPSYAAGLPPHEFFDLTWQHPWQYDPAIIERDFDMLDKMGINCISFGLNHGAPMRDVCMRAEKHGIKLHIATGGTHPLGLNFDTIKETVGSMGIARSSAVFSYDLGWEVHVGGYETRQRYNEKWTRWITDNYGSRENAFEDWGFTPPADKRDPALLDGPTDGQITGKEQVSPAYIAAYRRFMDETISKGYQYSVRELRKYDPLTLMGARSGYGGTGAEGVAAVMPFDLKAGVRHLDYAAPEAYNIGADRAGFLRGHLNNVYGRFV